MSQYIPSAVEDSIHNIWSLGGDMPTKFRNVILAHSTNQSSFGTAIREWLPVLVENEWKLHDDISCHTNQCICSHDIQDLRFVKNEINGTILMIGNSCIDKFEYDFPIALSHIGERSIVNTRIMCLSCFRYNILSHKYPKYCNQCVKKGHIGDFLGVIDYLITDLDTRFEKHSQIERCIDPLLVPKKAIPYLKQFLDKVSRRKKEYFENSEKIEWYILDIYESYNDQCVVGCQTDHKVMVKLINIETNEIILIGITCVNKYYKHLLPTLIYLTNQYHFLKNGGDKRMCHNCFKNTVDVKPHWKSFCIHCLKLGIRQSPTISQIGFGYKFCKSCHLLCILPDESWKITCSKCFNQDKKFEVKNDSILSTAYIKRCDASTVTKTDENTDTNTKSIKPIHLYDSSLPKEDLDFGKSIDDVKADNILTIESDDYKLLVSFG